MRRRLEFVALSLLAAVVGAAVWTWILRNWM